MSSIDQVDQLKNFFNEEEEFDRSPLLTLIRHPETIANISHALQGATDSPLTVNGQQQSKRLADNVAKSVNLTWKNGLDDQNGNTIQKFKSIRWIYTSEIVRAHGNTPCPLLNSGRPPTMILSSPAGRASNLAKEICDSISEISRSNSSLRKSEEEGLYSCPSVIIREGLAERNFGAREGMIYSRGQIKPTKDLVDPKERAMLKSESSPIFQNRVREEFDYLCSILQQQDSSSLFPHHIVVITHGLWIRTALEIAFGHVRQPFTNNTGIFTLALLDHSSRALAVSSSGLNKFGMVCQNDTSHLIGLKRQRGGIGSMASDRKQQTLKQVWHSPSKSVPIRETIETNSIASSNGEKGTDPSQILELPSPSQISPSKMPELLSIQEQQKELKSNSSSEGKRNSSISKQQNRDSPNKRQRNLLQMWKSTGTS